MIPIRARGGRHTDEEEPTLYILSDDEVGIAIADLLQAEGHRVTLVDESYDSNDVPGYVGDPADATVLAETDVGAASTVVITTLSDSQTFLIAQLVRARYGVPRVITLVNDPDRVPLFAAAGHEPFCVTTALSEALVEVV